MSVDRAEQEHLDKVRNRFTTTAESFSEFVLSRRADEADLLATMATSALGLAAGSVALDVACGPGTLSLPFTLRFARVVGLDFTLEMLRKAQQAAERSG